jgi:hypothetical protein
MPIIADSATCTLRTNIFAYQDMLPSGHSIGKNEGVNISSLFLVKRRILVIYIVYRYKICEIFQVNEYITNY